MAERQKQKHVLYLAQTHTEPLIRAGRVRQALGSSAFAQSARFLADT